MQGYGSGKRRVRSPNSFSSCGIPSKLRRPLMEKSHQISSETVCKRKRSSQFSTAMECVAHDPYIPHRLWSSLQMAISCLPSIITTEAAHSPRTRTVPKSGILILRRHIFSMRICSRGSNSDKMKSMI